MVAVAVPRRQIPRKALLVGGIVLAWLVLWLVFPRVWTALLGILWIIAMALSRTLLSVHWATDTLGGALVGAGVVLVLGAWLLPWVQTHSRRDAERSSIG